MKRTSFVEDGRTFFPVFEGCDRVPDSVGESLALRPAIGCDLGESLGEIGRHMTSLCEEGGFTSQCEGGRDDPQEPVGDLTSPVDDGDRGSDGEALDARSSPEEVGISRNCISSPAAGDAL